MGEPLQPPGLAPALPTPRRVEWLLAVLPLETVLVVVLGSAPLPLAASVFLSPPALGWVRHHRLGPVAGRLPAVLALAVVALAARLAVSEVFGGVGVL